MRTPTIHRIVGQLVLLLALLASMNQASADDGRVYSFGIVPQFEARRIAAIWQPILAELETRTGLRFEIRGAPTIPEFEVEFLRGAFDFAYMNPYHAVLAHRDQGYVPLVRDTGRQLYGVLVVRKDSAIDQVAGLDGKDVAFPSPNALGASLQMRADMADIHGIRISPKYVKTHDSVYLNVLLGQVAAGGGVQKTLSRQSEEIRNALRVIYTTRKAPPHPVVAHPRVPEAVRRLVAEALLALGAESSGKALLEKVPMKQVGVAVFEDYAPLLTMKLDRFYVEPSH